MTTILHRPARVVLADDQMLVRRVIRRLLGRVPNVEVVGEAADGAEALKMILAMIPDIVVLDVNMPRRDGVSVAEQTLQALPNAQVLLHSGAATPEQHRRANELGLTIGDKVPLEVIVATVQERARARTPALTTRVPRAGA